MPTAATSASFACGTGRRGGLVAGAAAIARATGRLISRVLTQRLLRLDLSDDAVDAGQEAFLSARQGTGLALIEQLVHEACDRKFKDSEHSQFILGIRCIRPTSVARKAMYSLSLVR